jgi:hypothetical protein
MRLIPPSGWWGLASAGGGIATVTLQRMTGDQLGDEFGLGTHDWAVPGGTARRPHRLGAAGKRLTKKRA